MRREPTERTSVTLPLSLATRLALEARRTGTSASALVREALVAFFTEAPDPGLPSFVGVVAGATDAAGDDALADARSAEVTGRKKRGR